MTTRAKKPNHRRDPLRKIVRREVQAGKPFILLACGHTSPGRPASRYSRFFPCVACAEVVKRYRSSGGLDSAKKGGRRGSP